MKITQKIKRLMAIALLAFVAISFNGCEVEEDDLRDVLIGSYNCTVKLYLLDGGELYYMGSDYDLNNKEFNATKSSSDDEMTFSLEGTTIFTANEFVEASNGTLFNVKNGTFDFHTTGMVDFSGYEENYTLDDVGYSGGYMNDSQKIRVTLQFEGNYAGSTRTFISWIEGPKN